MADEIDPIEQAKRAVFGDRADLAKVTTVGSGISQTSRVSVDLLANLDWLNLMTEPWVANRDMVVQLFTPIFERSRRCPGRDQPQCCQRGDANQPCYPNWREREEPEWYAQQIDVYLSMVDRRLREATASSSALAADEAFELGCLFTEAAIKFQWDRDTKRGVAIIEGARRGGETRLMRLPVEITVFTVDQLIAKGKGKEAAYEEVAKQQNVSRRTVANVYRAAKKHR